MSEIHELGMAVAHIGRIRGRNDKMALIKQYAALDGFKEIMRFIFDPYIRTGIAARKLEYVKAPLDSVPLHWRDVIQHFTLHRTGNAADVLMAKIFINRQETREAMDLARAIITKSLTIGITEVTLNKLYGDDFIPKIGIMRGEHYKDQKKKPIGPFIVTEKLDGARRLVVKEKGVVSIYTRSGHLDEGLYEIELEATKYLPDNIVLDTELLAIGTFNNAIELRQASNSIGNSKGARGGARLHVFDVIALDEFKRGTCSHTTDVRKMLVGAMFGDESIKHIAPNYIEFINKFKLDWQFRFFIPVPILGLASTEAEILAIAEPIWKRGFEGIMLNTFNGKYEQRKVKHLLKVKATEEMSLVCTGIFEGEGKYTGMMGGIYLQYKDNPSVGCGSGLTDLDRLKYWSNPELIIGKRIEIDTFGESTNQGGGVSLNCPIFKRVAGQKE